MTALADASKLSYASELADVSKLAYESKLAFACKYTPIELIAAFGVKTLFINNEADSFEKAEQLGHSNLCGYTKSLIEYCHKHQIRQLFLVNCCDSMRRTYDVLHAEGCMDFLFLMDLPDCGQKCARDMLASELSRFAVEYGAFCRAEFDTELFRNAFRPPAALPETRFVGMLGARASGNLIRELEERLPYPVVDMTCCGNRRVLPINIGQETGKASAQDYAAELLAQTPCMRMNSHKERLAQLQNPNMEGLVYHTVSFCDYYTFEYEDIRTKVSVPILKLESDYSIHGRGQLHTRIDAFAESLHREKIPANAPARRTGKYVAGLDSGSTTTKAALLNSEGTLISCVTVRTGAKASASAARALQEAYSRHGLSKSDIAGIAATGYGRQSVPGADEIITEISCHARGARYFDPQVRSVIDIGGQDSKVICLDDAGNVVNFVMNDKCAAGTGRFLEMMARVLELELDELAGKGMAWNQDLTISSVCSVFAESEVVALIADDNSEEDIIHGINKAVAAKTAMLASRCGAKAPYMMTGGVALNCGVVAALKDKLSAPISVSTAPEMCGAIGAALYALETVFGQSLRYNSRDTDTSGA